MLHAAEQSDLRAQLVQQLKPVWPDVRQDEVLAAIDIGGQPTAESFWTLDPIDGTKGFLRQGQYAISLAYLCQGKVELGVLGCPNLSADWERPFDDPDPHGLIVYAKRGGGCWAVPAANGGARPLGVMCSASQGTTLRVCESQEAAHSDQALTARIATLLGGATPVRLDSQAKYAVVARGQADAYLRIPRSSGYEENIWDHAAGMLVATEAGASVSDIIGNALDFTTGKTLARNRGILCASPAWHQRILGAINSLGLVPDRQ